jgi:predicted RNase H-like HicB family nuclease
MLTEYINAAMSRAHYQILPENEGFFGEINLLKGVWSNSETLEKCRDELREVLEEWIIFGLKNDCFIPVIDNIDLNLIVKRAA